VLFLQELGVQIVEVVRDPGLASSLSALAWRAILPARGQADTRAVEALAGARVR
jgi:hypothetical protein